MKQFIEEGRIPSECSPKDLSRFCSNLYTLLQKTGLGKKVTSTLKAIEMEITQTSNEMFPRSISLFQYCLAIHSQTKIPGTTHQHVYLEKEKQWLVLLCGVNPCSYNEITLLYWH